MDPSNRQLTQGQQQQQQYQPQPQQQYYYQQQRGAPTSPPQPVYQSQVSYIGTTPHTSPPPTAASYQTATASTNPPAISPSTSQATHPLSSQAARVAALTEPIETFRNVEPPLARLLADQLALRLQIKDLEARLPRQPHPLAPPTDPNVITTRVIANQVEQYLDEHLEPTIKKVVKELQESNQVAQPQPVAPSNLSYATTSTSSSYDRSSTGPPSPTPSTISVSGSYSFQPLIPTLSIPPSPISMASMTPASSSSAPPQILTLNKLYELVGSIHGQLITQINALRQDPSVLPTILSLTQELTRIQYQEIPRLTPMEQQQSTQFLNMLQQQREEEMKKAQQSQLPPQQQQPQQPYYLQQQQLQQHQQHQYQPPQQQPYYQPAPPQPQHHPPPQYSAPQSLIPPSHYAAPPTTYQVKSEPQQQFYSYNNAAAATSNRPEYQPAVVKAESPGPSREQPMKNEYAFSAFASSVSSSGSAAAAAATSSHTIPDHNPLSILEKCGFKPFDFTYRTSAVNHIKSLLRDKVKVSASALANEVWHFESKYNLQGAQEWRARVRYTVPQTGHTFQGPWTDWHLVKTQATEESAVKALRAIQHDPHFKNLFLKPLPGPDDPNPISAVINYLRDKSVWKKRLLDERVSIEGSQFHVHLFWGEDHIGTGAGSDKVIAKTQASIDVLNQWQKAMQMVEKESYETLQQYPWLDLPASNNPMKKMEY